MEQTLIWYHLALFLHLCALLAAMSVSGISHYAEVRMGKARVTGELMEWATLFGRAGRIFPFALLTLVATGAYMVSMLWTWSTGWIEAALVGVVALFAGGIFFGIRITALRRALAGDPESPINARALRMANSLLVRAVSHGNTALAIGVVFIMVSKGDLFSSILALAVAYAIGVALAIALGRSHRAAASQAQREQVGAR